MKTKYILLLFFLVVAFAACTKNDYTSYCPTWKGFTYKTGNYPNYIAGNPRKAVLQPGDSVHITAHQLERGHLINATHYTWTICYDTLDTRSTDDPSDDRRVRVESTYNFRTNYDGYVNGADDPVGHLYLHRKALPSNSVERYSIKFNARYAYSGQGVTVESGNVVENGAYGGSISPQSGPTGGGAYGTLYFTVE